ncbi:hypothetical protein BB780_00635 [Stenotrophomonas maltophilia]|nr:hypothetical protein BB780_00635 [Stenotrophomonas maltophilia]
MKETCSCGALLLFSEFGSGEQVAALGGFDFHAAKVDDRLSNKLAFACSATSGERTQVNTPRHEFG